MSENEKTTERFQVVSGKSQRKEELRLAQKTAMHKWYYYFVNTNLLIG